MISIANICQDEHAWCLRLEFYTRWNRSCRSSTNLRPRATIPSRLYSCCAPRASFWIASYLFYDYFIIRFVFHDSFWLNYLFSICFIWFLSTLVLLFLGSLSRVCSIIYGTNALFRDYFLSPSQTKTVSFDDFDDIWKPASSDSSSSSSSSSSSTAAAASFSLPAPSTTGNYNPNHPTSILNSW